MAGRISGISTFQSGANETSQSWNLNYAQANLTQTVGTTTTTLAYYDNVHLLGTPDFTLQPTITCNPKKALTAPHEYLNPACFAPASANGGFGTGGMPNLAVRVLAKRPFADEELQDQRAAKPPVPFCHVRLLNHDLPLFTTGDSNLHASFNAHKAN